MSRLTEGLNGWLHGPSHPSIYDAGHWFSNHEIAADVDEVRRLLMGSGIQPRDTVVLGYPNSYAFTVTYFALLAYGAVVAPVNPGMAPAELYLFLTRSQAVAAFVTDAHWRAIRATRSDTAELPLHTVFVRNPEHSLHTTAHRKQMFNWHSFDPLPVDIPNQTDEPAEEDVAVLLYTSGTTGRPKAVGLQHKHLFLTGQNVIQSHGLTHRDVTYCFLPLFHINAEVVALLATCLSGGRIVLGTKFTAKGFWPTIAQQGVTWVSAVPTVIAILLKHPGPAQVPKHLRFVRSASAQLPADHERAFEQTFGVPIIQSYGMTEAASQICVNSLDPGQKRIRSVGRPVGLELTVVGDDDAQVLPHQIGEIAIRGDNVIDRYVQADNQDDFRAGWFHTGDLGYVDEDGFVYLVGRKKEMINRAGEKVSPYEVEDVIRAHAAVRQVAVIGMPDPLYGERVAAYVIAEIDERFHHQLIAEVLTHCKENLSSFKVPSEVYVVSELPVGPTGKIQRSRLKQQVLCNKSE